MTYQEKLRTCLKQARAAARKLPVSAERKTICEALTTAAHELALPADWPWGPVVEQHRVGTFVIVEYEDVPSGTEGKRAFYVSECGHFDTLDEALLGALCAKHGSVNDTEYVMRILQKESLP